MKFVAMSKHPLNGQLVALTEDGELYFQHRDQSWGRTLGPYEYLNDEGPNGGCEVEAPNNVSPILSLTK